MQSGFRWLLLPPMLLRTPALQAKPVASASHSAALLTSVADALLLLLLLLLALLVLLLGPPGEASQAGEVAAVAAGAAEEVFWARAPIRGEGTEAAAESLRALLSHLLVRLLWQASPLSAAALGVAHNSSWFKTCKQQAHTTT